MHNSSVSWKISPLYFCSSNNIYFGHKEPIKVKFFETCECSGQNLSNSLVQILYPYSILWKITTLYITQTIYTLLKRITLNENIWDFKVLWLKFVKFLMSTLKWQVNCSSNFASFFIVMTDNSSVDFKLIVFQLWIKGSHQNPTFEIFKCSGENLPCSSCHFPNHKSVESNVR